MNKILLLFLIASFFAPILSDICPDTDQLYIINHGTGLSLGNSDQIQTRILKQKGFDVNAELGENKRLHANENEGVDDNEELVENDNEEFLGKKGSDDSETLDENENNVVDDTVNKSYDDNDEKALASAGPIANVLKLRFKIALDLAYQKWCFNDASRTFYDSYQPPSNRYSTKTNIIYNGVRYTRGIEVMNGNLRRPVIDLFSTSQASFSGDWSISYLKKSGMFSIRYLRSDGVGLALSAVSSHHADGLTLKKFNPRNPLQQWIIQAV